MLLLLPSMRKTPINDREWQWDQLWPIAKPLGKPSTTSPSLENWRPRRWYPSSPTCRIEPNQHHGKPHLKGGLYLSRGQARLPPRANPPFCQKIRDRRPFGRQDQILIRQPQGWFRDRFLGRPKNDAINNSRIKKRPQTLLTDPSRDHGNGSRMNWLTERKTQGVRWEPAASAHPCQTTTLRLGLKD